MPEIEALSKKVSSLRHDYGENQFEFADNCGISVYTLSLIECGTANPRIDTLQKIAAYTGMTVSELLKIE